MKMSEETVRPPPRKVKPTVQLKNVHSEQTAKLQAKHQQECDLLDDIRTFSKQRSVLEKEYAQGLMKLAGQLMKREFTSAPELTHEDGTGYKTAVTVWRCILEETEKVAMARLQAAEMYLQKIFEQTRPLKTVKVHALKKANDQLTMIQTEVSQSVREMNKAHKVYSVDETLSNDARLKATEADDRLKKKSTGLFQSVSSLQRNCAKFSSRKDSFEAKSTASRNEYILSRAAANAHQIRYYSTDLPGIMRMLDGEVYEKVQEYFTLIGKTAVECSGMEQECFSRVLAQSGLVSHQYNLQCFLHNNLVFTDLLQYQFDPCHGDMWNTVSKEHNAEHHLDKEARKWATKIAKESRAVKDYTKTLNILLSGEYKPESPLESKDGKDANNQDPEVKIEEIKQSIRKAETAKMKAEARIEALRVAGVNVEEWLTSTRMDSLAIEEEEISRTPSQVSIRTDSSGGHSEEHESTYHNFEDDDDDFLDETFDVSRDSTGYRSERHYPLTCVALYDFQASNVDELEITLGESLELVADGDGDGWVKARSVSGKTGYIPEIYVKFPDDVASLPAINEGRNSHVAETSSHTSGEYCPGSEIVHDTSSSYSSMDYEVQQTTDQMSGDSGRPPSTEGSWCRALYDYEATSEEELQFSEGTLIRLLRKDENGIDDGWWEGELNGKLGVFPSLVVEELSGLPDEDPETPVETIPPTFSPPPPVTVTLPTPDQDPSAGDTVCLEDQTGNGVCDRRRGVHPCQRYNHWNGYAPVHCTRPYT